MRRFWVIAAIFTLAVPTLALATGNQHRPAGKPAARPAPHARAVVRAPLVRRSVGHGPVGHGPVVHSPTVHGPVVHGPTVHGSVVRGNIGPVHAGMPYLSHGHPYAWHPVHFPTPLGVPAGLCLSPVGRRRDSTADILVESDLLLYRLERDGIAAARSGFPICGIWTRSAPGKRVDRRGRPGVSRGVQLDLTTCAFALLDVNYGIVRPWPSAPAHRQRGGTRQRLGDAQEHGGLSITPVRGDILHARGRTSACKNRSQWLRMGLAHTGLRSRLRAGSFPAGSQSESKVRQTGGRTKTENRRPKIRFSLCRENSQRRAETDDYWKLTASAFAERRGHVMLENHSPKYAFLISGLAASSLGRPSVKILPSAMT